METVFFCLWYIQFWKFIKAAWHKHNLVIFFGWLWRSWSVFISVYLFGWGKLSGKIFSTRREPYFPYLICSNFCKESFMVWGATSSEQLLFRSRYFTSCYFGAAIFLRSSFFKPVAFCGCYILRIATFSDRIFYRAATSSD